MTANPSGRAIRRRPKPEEVAPPPRAASDVPKSFPPVREFASLSLRDLLDARDAYHVHLSHLENVVATAVGRYLFRENDWHATHPPDVPRPDDFEQPEGERTLGNSLMRAWSWPCVLVFVRKWERSSRLRGAAVPRRLYLPDGRQVPTCVVLGTPDESLPPPVTQPGFASELLGGGYRCERRGQGVTEVGTFACLVRREGTYYALTNSHVAGAVGEPVYARIRGEPERVGISDGERITKRALKSLFPEFGESHAFVNVDAGLVKLDDVSRWTSQVYGVGEVGELFDATASTLTLDLVGLPVRAFGGSSGVLEGEIKALFFRYQSLGDFDYVSDLLIGQRRAPQVPGARSKASARPPDPPPQTLPGDSGTLWFYDPPSGKRPIPKGAVAPPPDPPERGARARRLRPIAMQWGGQRVALPNGQRSAFALATFLSTVCRMLDVEIVRSWSTGHDEYWGKIGHFAVGWKACNLFGNNKLGKLMRANQANIGFGNDKLGEGSEFTMGRGEFVPLSDVPDYKWIANPSRREKEAIQHFADIDIAAIDGGPSMLEACRADSANLDPAVWRDYFQGFADAGVGPEPGALPFRVWQLFDDMVAAAKAKDVRRFVGNAGVLAHYVGDASQPLHSSYLHHGRLPMVQQPAGEYPVPHSSDEYGEYKKTRAAKIHGIYEEGMLEVDALGALQAVDALLDGKVATSDIDSGYEAAVAVFELMSDAQARLSPETIIDADDPDLTERQRAQRLWANLDIRTETERSLAASALLLARLWASAWRLGKGSKIPTAKLVRLTEPELTNLVKQDDFATAMTLDEMVDSGRFVVP